MKTYRAALLAHYERRFAASVWARQWHEPPHPSLSPLPPEFEVRKYKRSADTALYATVCMSDADAPTPLELHIIAADDEATGSRSVFLLTVTAHFHRTGHNLDIGHTVNFGEPWVPGGACSRALISRPYLDGPKFEREPTRGIRCAWLVPVTDSEVSYKKEFGLEALESKFETMQIDALDWTRPSVV
ncbi:MAG: suppressor of fused domain protein [Archangium sp.]|nr:suppressor of fused domain protein [Archangium sp.]